MLEGRNATGPKGTGEVGEDPGQGGGAACAILCPRLLRETRAQTVLLYPQLPLPPSHPHHGHHASPWTRTGLPLCPRLPSRTEETVFSRGKHHMRWVAHYTPVGRKPIRRGRGDH